MIAKSKGGAPFTIDPEFSGLIPPLTEAEFAQLEANLLEDGCQEPLTLWANHDTLLDGHHRFKICERHNIAFKTRALRFETKEDAKQWCLRHQLGQRNLTPDQASYLRGKLYNALKTYSSENLKKGLVLSERTESPFGQTTTSEVLAKEHGVDERTIRRDGDFAEAVDTIAEVAPEVRDAILTGEVKATRADVSQAAALPPKQLAKVAEKVASGKATKLKDALPKKPKPGSPVVDVRKFQKAKANVGKLVREMTDLKEHAGGASFHARIRSNLNEILSTIDEWQKAAVK